MARLAGLTGLLRNKRLSITGGGSDRGGGGCGVSIRRCCRAAQRWQPERPVDSAGRFIGVGVCVGVDAPGWHLLSTRTHADRLLGLEGGELGSFVCLWS